MYAVIIYTMYTTGILLFYFSVGSDNLQVIRIDRKSVGLPWHSPPKKQLQDSIVIHCGSNE